MNETLKERLDAQGAKVGEAMKRHEDAKAKLAMFDGITHTAIRSTGVKRTEADVDALKVSAEGRGHLFDAVINTKAELEAADVETKCLLAHVSLVCSEIAANSRISG